jgi:hypothetical protein
MDFLDSLIGKKYYSGKKNVRLRRILETECLLSTAKKKKEITLLQFLKWINYVRK